MECLKRGFVDAVSLRFKAKTMLGIPVEMTIVDFEDSESCWHERERPIKRKTSEKVSQYEGSPGDVEQTVDRLGGFVFLRKGIFVT